MVTLFTVAPSNRSNTELQNKKQNSPDPLNKSGFTATFFYYAGKAACLKKKERRRRSVKERQARTHTYTHTHIHTHSLL